MEKEKFSFKGVQIDLYSSGIDRGRRVQIDELPFSESVYAFDMGREATKLSLRGFILGPDLETKRKAIERALGTPSAGELIHPEFGRLRAICVRHGINSKWDQRNLLEIDAQFVRADEFKAGQKEVYSADDKTSEVSNLTGAISFKADPAQIFGALLSDATTGIKTLESSVQKFVKPGNDLRVTAQRISSIKENLTSILKSPGNLATEYNLLTSAILSDLGSLSGVKVSRQMISQYKDIKAISNSSKFDFLKTSNSAAHSQIICLSFAPTLLSLLTSSDGVSSDDAKYFSQSTEDIAGSIEDPVLFSKFEVFRSKSRAILASSRVLKAEPIVYDDIIECYENTGDIALYSSLEDAKPLRLL